MRWSWKLAQVAGIDVYMHATFVVLLVWVLLIHLAQGESLATAVQGLLFILLIFACVVLHELGHALTAKKYGIKTRDITLLPIGGLARLERIPQNPRQELWVALAGPAVNVVIVLFLLGLLGVAGGIQPLDQVNLTTGSLIQRLMLINVVLVVFNMLPAFPMDGGRVLRALLATRMEYTTATQLAASVGQAMAFLFGLIGLFTNPFLVIIALFVWIGATQESSMVQIKSALSGIPVQRAMITDFHTVSPHDALSRVVSLTLSGSQKDFPVVENGRIVGVVRQEDLLRSLAEEKKDLPVTEVMSKDFAVADPYEMLEPVFARLRDCDCRTLPVVDSGTLVGLVTMDNLGEFLRIQTALAKPRSEARII